MAEELTSSDYRFIARTQSGHSTQPQEDDERPDWPAEITTDEREEIIKTLRGALGRWKAGAGGETFGGDYVILDNEEVDGGTLSNTISIHNLAIMFAELILRASRQPQGPDYLGVNDSLRVTVDDIAEHSKHGGYELEEYIRKPNSFFSFLVAP